MTPEIYPTDLTVVKFIIAAVFAWCCACLGGCAFASPGGYSLVLAPRATHELYVGAPMDSHTPEDKQKLEAVIRRGY